MGCGLFQIVPELEADTRCDCVRCGLTLRRERRDPLNRGLALNCAGLVLFIIVWTTMLMKVSTMGIMHETTLSSGPMELVRQGLWPLAIAVGFTTGLAPAVRFAGLIYVLVGLRMPRPPPNLRGVFRIVRTINTWAMLEVLLLGVFVAYTKLGRYRAGARRSVGRDRTHRPDPCADAGWAAARLAAPRRGLRVLRPGERTGGARPSLSALRRDAA